jgi:histidinol phosphatase-like PHP family hydrolase
MVIIKWKQYNIEFVLGCDAHSPEQLDDDAVRFIENLAQELNLKVINTFYKLDL